MFSLLLGGSHTQRADVSCTAAGLRGFTAEHMDSAAHPAKGGHRQHVAGPLPHIARVKAASGEHMSLIPCS